MDEVHCRNEKSMCVNPALNKTFGGGSAQDRDGILAGPCQIYWMTRSGRKKTDHTESQSTYCTKFKAKMG